VRSPRLTVSNLKLPDGTRVRFMLGLVGCGVMTAGRGEAVVQNGCFELPLNGEDDLPRRDLELFLKPATGGKFACELDDEVLVLRDVTPAPGTVVDATAVEPVRMGCWLFGDER
jgi:hypothetical protein